MSPKFWKLCRRRGGQTIRCAWAAMAGGVLLYFLILGILASGLIPPSVGKFYQELALKPDVTIGDTANVIVALVALCALFLAWYQLRGLTLQTRATVLMSLDERWESPEILVLRRRLNRFRDHVKSQTSNVSEEERFAQELEQLRTTNQKKYTKLFRLCGFFETLGYAVRAKYIRLADVYGLLEGAIVDSGAVFRRHIRDRQEALRNEGSEHADGYYEHYVWLVDAVINKRRTEG